MWIASLVGTLDFVSTRIGWGDDHRSRFPFCAGSPVGIHGRSLGRSDLLGAQGPCKTQTSTELIVCGDPYAEARISQHLFGLNNFSAWTTFVPNNFSVSTTFGLNRVRSQQRFGFHPSFGSHPPSGSHPPFGLNHLSVCCTETRVPCNCAVPAAVRSQRSFWDHSGVTQIGLPGLDMPLSSLSGGPIPGTTTLTTTYPSVVTTASDPSRACIVHCIVARY